MAKKELVESIVKLYSKLGGNIGDVLGSRSNITFLGTGKNPEPFVDMSINMEAVGALGKNKILEELKSPLGYLTADKLNDVQAGKLYENMLKLDEFYNPKAAPANIIDMGTGTRNLDQKGLASLRRMTDETADVDLPEGVDPRETILPTSNLMGRIEGRMENIRKLSSDLDKARKEYRNIYKSADDLPPPGSRGGADDIAAPFQSADETIANLEKQEAGLGEKFKTLITNKADIPMKRATAREFLVLALRDTDDFAFGKTTLSDFMTATDRKYVIEGGGGIAGDPIVLVEKYFGPRIAEAIPERGLKNDEIIEFTRRVLNNVVDANGNKPDSPRFDRCPAQFVDDMAKGGLAKILEV